mgnify:CR=1 FL=1
MFTFRSIILVALWSFIVFLSLYFFFDNVIAYFCGYRSRMFGDTLFHNQLWVVMHMVGGSMALLLGPMQFWPFIRKRFVSFHRLSGKIYMAAIALIGISSGRLSLISSCVPCRISLFLLTVFAVLSTWFAWRAIKTRNTKVHRQMMVRSYVCDCFCCSSNQWCGLSQLFIWWNNRFHFQKSSEWIFLFVCAIDHCWDHYDMAAICRIYI